MTRKPWIPFLLITLLSLLIFVVFSHMRPLLPAPWDVPFRLALLLLLFLGRCMGGKITGMEKYRGLLYAFFTASAAMAVDYLLPTGPWLLRRLAIPLTSPWGLALDKLDSTLLLTAMILLLTRLSGKHPRDLYLRKGNLRQGLLLGFLLFALCTLGALPMASLFGAKNLSFARILPWIPSMLLFVLANAFNEELLFRGLFLRDTSTILGKTFGNVVLVLPFVLHHTGVTYSASTALLFLFLFPLAFLWGCLTQKAGSLWGSVLFHAGTDLPVVLALFSQLPPP
ncbi:CPBP family intramembrane metalloprotease [Proteiniclasticum sp. BAD-10]|uniref:CPBP family intramembrane metalloprotease n=1 Tax=Proteiniclasticum sediminis TaxID=2804028 RepID=A0A941HQ23_9CLOT|nr:CPBP family intramembrane glutamic endopeptidase [Proteiniclasticum sediminis]MBR0576011.1 CPBP family intramembrane metalloprotease [Proteiniclasticum sediminis]